MFGELLIRLCYKLLAGLFARNGHHCQNNIYKDYVHDVILQVKNFS